MSASANYPHVFVNNGFGCGYVSFVVISLSFIGFLPKADPSIVERPNREPKPIRSLNPNRKTMNKFMPKSKKSGNNMVFAIGKSWGH